MDKTWTKFPRVSDAYQEGAKSFIENCKKRARNPDRIMCPCAKCKNYSSKTAEELFEHLVVNGIDPQYKIWCVHGESASNDEGEQNKSSQRSNKGRMFRDTSLVNDSCPEHTHNANVPEDFAETFTEAETPLYPKCTKYTKLSATIALYKLKAKNGISDNAFTEMMELFHDMLPADNTLPDSLYAVKEFLKEFNFGYEKIDACINDCCLFRKEYEHLDNCPKCGASRWKINSRTNEPEKC